MRVRASPASLVVSLSKNINPSLVLVQLRKTRPFITERLLMGRKESNQTNQPLIQNLANHFNIRDIPYFSKVHQNINALSICRVNDSQGLHENHKP